MQGIHYDKVPPVGKRLKLLARLAFIAMLAFGPLFVPSPASATVAQPDSAPTITNPHVNRNLVTSGDILFYATYDLPYAAAPTVSATNAYIFRLIDTDGTTELARITPFAYSYFDNGYNLGAVFFYLESHSLVWGTAYRIRISQNPAQFASPQYWDTTLTADAYSSVGTDKTDNQDELANNVLDIADALELEYSVDMTEPNSGSTVLSYPYGERYFRGACAGIQAMAPSLYTVEKIELDYTSTNFTLTQADANQSQLDATWVGAAENATATQFGTTMIPGIMLGFLPALGAMVISSMRYKKFEPGLIAASIWLIGAQAIGWLPTAVFASTFQAMAIYTGYVWFYARA